MGGGYLVRLGALALVIHQEPVERLAGDDHAAVLEVVTELRRGGRPAQEDDLKPAVLDPAQVGHRTGHRHQERAREHRPVSVRVGQPFAFHVNDRPLQVKPADKLSPLIAHERRAPANRRHTRRRYPSR
jgi:hypothetical protein